MATNRALLGNGRAAWALRAAGFAVLAGMAGAASAQSLTKPLELEQQGALVVDSQATQRGKASTKTPAPMARQKGGALSFSNATAITITDCPNPCPASGQAASLYPSPITVVGVPGVVQRVTVTLTGFSHAFPADVDFLLVSPSGRKSVLMSDFGAGSPGVSNIDIVMDDYAQRPIPSTVTGNTGVPFVTGAYRPANSGTTDLFPAPAPAAPYTYTLSAFNGDDPNGTWNLYIIDDANLDGGTLSGGWTIAFDAPPAPPGPGDILISEFRTRGAGTTPPGSDGSADEFIEIYNNTDASITIVDSLPGADPTSPTGAGWRFAGAQGAAETTFLVLPQTLSTAGPIALPPRGYFLISTQPTTPSPAGNTYSLATYPTGTGITASGSANVSVNPASATVGFLPDDVGLAVFSTAAALSPQRLDAVGYSSVTAVDYKEGSGLSPAAGITTAGQHSWVRREITGVPQDSGDNAADFVLVDTTAATLNGIAAILGAPGPERGNTMTAFTTTSAPIHDPTSPMASALIDPLQPESAAPNRVRDMTPVTNGALGTLKIRRQYTNNSGAALIALRYRIVDISTLTGSGVAPGSADLRALNSPTQTITLTDTSSVTAQALTLQTPPAQASGGGHNSSLAEGVITTTAPLANGASTIVEFNFGVQVDGNFKVTVMVEGLQGDGLGGVSAIDTFQTVIAADLSITKDDGATTATPGGQVIYTLVGANAGPDAVVGASIQDTFPPSLTCSWTCVGAGGGTCTAAGTGNLDDAVNLPAAASVTYTATCDIDPAATGSLANTATIAGPADVMLEDPDTEDQSATDTDTLTPAADLSITKTDGVGMVLPGGNTTYTITASNAGPSHAPGASVTDTFPASLTCTWTCVGAGGGTCTAAGAGNLADTVNLPSGGSVTYTASCTVANAATGSIANTATVAAPEGVTDGTPGNDSATDTDTVQLQADLSITKTDGVTSATAGGSATYTITASNAGPSGATGASVTDTFPAALTCTWTCVGAGGGTCTAAGAGNIADTVNLPSGGSVTYTASCSISASATGSISNTTNVAAPEGTTDPNAENNSATDIDALGASADLAITKTDGTTTVTAGGTATYTITASNLGPSNAAGATVTDTFPAALTCTWTCVGAGGGTCTAAGAGNIADTVNLPSGGSVTYTASCSISASATGSITNTANVAAPEGTTDPNAENNSATDIDALGASADLAVTKTDGVTSATAGGSTTYTITASNVGPSGATGASVTDTFPAALTCTWTCVGAGGGTCTAAGAGNIADTVNLPSGGSVTYTASCSISPSATGSITNTANVAAPEGTTDPNAENNSATDIDALGASADLAITKTDGTTTVTAGGTATYTITASNAGPSTAMGASVTDTFPAALTCTWTCVGAGGGTCTAAGAGNIADTVNLPSGGSVTYTASCSISGSTTGSLVNTATIAAPEGVTDTNPGNNTATDTDVITATPAVVSGSKSVTGTFEVGGTVTYTIVLDNTGSGAQADNPGNEFTDVLPATLALVSATATSGTASANLGTNTVTWNGGIAAGASVTITITATILPSAAGVAVSNQGTIAFDSDANGSNDANAVTDNPATGGSGEATTFMVAGGGAAFAEPITIPTLSTLGLLLMLGLIAGVGLLRQRGQG